MGAIWKRPTASVQFAARKGAPVRMIKYRPESAAAPTRSLYHHIAGKTGVTVRLPNGKTVRLSPSTFRLKSANTGDVLLPFSDTRPDQRESVYVELGPDAAELETLSAAATDKPTSPATTARMEELATKLRMEWARYKKTHDFNDSVYAPPVRRRERAVKPRPGVIDDDAGPTGGSDDTRRLMAQVSNAAGGIARSRGSASRSHRQSSRHW